MTATVSDEDRAQAEKVVADWCFGSDLDEHVPREELARLVSLIAASISAERERWTTWADAEITATRASEARMLRRLEELRARDTGDNR